MNLCRKHINCFILCSVYLVSTFINLSAQERPDWVERKGVSPWINQSEYLTGFGMASVPKKEDPKKSLEVAEENAKKNLAEKINVEIKSVTRVYKQQVGMDFQQKLESEIVSLANVEFPGLKKDVYVDERERLAYCMVYVPRKFLVKNYNYKIFNKNKELEGIYYLAQELNKNGQKAAALENYLKCFPVKDEITDLETILQGLGTTSDYESKISKSEINQCISSLITEIESLNDLAFFIAFAFQQQVKSDSLSGIIVAPLTYRNTGISSEFSKQFRETLEHYILTQNSWNTVPIKKYNPSIENMLNIRYSIKGTYWETDDNIHLNIYLNEILTGVKKASIEYTLDRQIVDESYFPLKPKNFEKALADQDTFSKSEIPSHGLLLEVITNKGSNDLVFTEGEKMNIFVKTNLPCYMQLIYHLSDSSRVLFLNNEYIDISKVNKQYELPFEFICSPPFGVETLQVNVMEDPFPEIETSTKDGIRYIDESLESILIKTRQIGREKLKAEKRITITTMPN